MWQSRHGNSKRTTALNISSIQSPHLPFLDQFRWGDLVQEGADVKSQPVWDWLANGLQLSRVRQTLRSFPINDLLNPLPLSQVEVWLPTKEDSEESKDVGENCYDGCYSPAYILPLILAALESCMEGRSETINKQKSEQRPDGHFKGSGDTLDHQLDMLAKMAQRLCDKGGLSLALASLSSKCSSLRQVAVAVIGFLTKAADSKEARELSSWRERPQLAMLLHSVQRAIVVRRATLLSKELGDDPEEEVPDESVAWLVPQLPGFSAIFLARAALVLARPGDAMYLTLNRFFLSIDDFSGAFRDLNRLPAFISFLCSGALEPEGQARMERFWALRLFTDGFLNEYCFKMASTCHAPELLLTNFYNHRARKSDEGGKQKEEEECMLLLQAIQKMVQRSGRHGAHMLIRQTGLLSWLRTILEKRILPELVPTRACQVALLEVLTTSVRQATTYHDQSNSHSKDRNYDADDDVDEVVDLDELKAARRDNLRFEVEITTLASATLDFGVTPLCDMRAAGKEPQPAILLSFAAASVDALMALQSALECVISTASSSPLEPIIGLTPIEHTPVHVYGIELATAVNYLTMISTVAPSRKKDAFSALAFFQVYPQIERKDAIRFCCLCLGFIAQHYTELHQERGASIVDHDLSSKNLVVSVMKRVSLLLERSKTSGEKEKAGEGNLIEEKSGEKDGDEKSGEKDTDEKSGDKGSIEKSGEEESIDTTDLLERLCESQTACFQWQESRDLWFDCRDLCCSEEDLITHAMESLPPEHR